jgi:hypothetical protein
MVPHTSSKLWWTKCKSDIGNAVGRDEEMIVVLGRWREQARAPLTFIISPGVRRIYAAALDIKYTRGTAMVGGGDVVRKSNFRHVM